MKAVEFFLKASNEVSSTYLADEEEIFKDGAVNLHHHDVSTSILVEELFTLHLASLDDHNDLLLHFVESWCLS